MPSLSSVLIALCIYYQLASHQNNTTRASSTTVSYEVSRWNYVTPAHSPSPHPTCYWQWERLKMVPIHNVSLSHCVWLSVAIGRMQIRNATEFNMRYMWRETCSKNGGGEICQCLHVIFLFTLKENEEGLIHGEGFEQRQRHWVLTWIMAPSSIPADIQRKHTGKKMHGEKMRETNF